MTKKKTLVSEGKVVIAGSRGIEQYPHMLAAINIAENHFNWKITTVVSGDAKFGVDPMGIEWAQSMNMPVELHPAQWKTHGAKAGLMRNSEMAESADMGIVLWDGQSKGSLHMYQRLKAKKKPVILYRVKLSKSLKLSRRFVNFYDLVDVTHIGGPTLHLITSMDKSVVLKYML